VNYKFNQGAVMRGKRILVHTCIGQVITRFMTEADITYRELFELTGVSKSTLHGWANGAVLENPDKVIILREVFSRLLKREITTDDILFGKDEDRRAMRELIAQKEKRINELERQLCFLELAARDA
jgi:transcriptional regulator with XRE-family HTH domain